MKHVILYTFSVFVYTSAIFMAGILAGRLQEQARRIKRYRAKASTLGLRSESVRRAY